MNMSILYFDFDTLFTAFISFYLMFYRGLGVLWTFLMHAFKRRVQGMRYVSYTAAEATYYKWYPY